MQTGENEQGLRKVIDFTRMVSVVILMLHFYFQCYPLFLNLGFSKPEVNAVLLKVARFPIFKTQLLAKTTALALLLVSLIGTKGKKDETANIKRASIRAAIGLAVYYGSNLFNDISLPYQDVSYIALSCGGYLLFLLNASRLFRVIRWKTAHDTFNYENETFPQEERLLENEFSVNLPATYNFKGTARKSWINIINPFRSTLITGTPGAGKSYFVVRHIITQHIQKGFSMFLYDFKFDDLTRIAYNTLRKNKDRYAVEPKFYVINFDDLAKTHRCNPLEPAYMQEITDAMEAARTFMLGLNREWIKKQGDFFVESPINFITALIWFLRKYEDGKYCTLPHVIELAQTDYASLFTLLQTEPEIEVLINPFISAWKNEAFDQLEGQIASAKISVARLVSPSLYYVLSGNDFSLDLNNPDAPKIISMGNNPLKQQVYGAVLSLYISRMIKVVNQKGRLKCNLIFDEFPTIYFNNMDSVIATARSNKVATTLAVQDYSQLKKDYGREQAEVIFNIVGNIISGQVSGDTAKQLSERFGKIIQDRQSTTLNSQDISVNRSTQLDSAIPPSTIASLSSGEFVGTIADDPQNKITLKMFHNQIINDHDAIRLEEENFEELPAVRQINQHKVMANYVSIKKDIQNLLMMGVDVDET